ncbi:MAG TPA: helix-turn-helix domain-containing protein, partial [Streptosporangiaceae bacterium]|nr:helix-turn-helix domain-containing protein [Streptosporangiaceae bacterium]
MADTRDRILDAATHVMRTRGFARTTTKEIARAAGYSEATLYKHFQDKT